MKKLTRKQQIEKLENKCEKLNSKIARLRKDEEDEKRKDAFDKIMELGKEFGLFRDIMIEENIGYIGNTREYTVKIIDPNPVEIINVC